MDEKKLAEYVKTGQVAKAFAYVIQLLQQSHTATNDNIADLGPFIDQRVKSVSTKADNLHQAAKDHTIEVVKKVRKGLRSDMANMQGYLEDKIDSVNDNREEYEYELTDQDKNDIVALISKAFPKAELEGMKETLEFLTNEVIKIKNNPSSGPVMGMGDFGGPLETIIRAGNNISLQKISGGYVISSTGGGSGGNVTTVNNEVLTFVDGQHFTISQAFIAGSEHLYYLGQRLTPTVDYTISGQNVTLLSFTATAGSVIGDYMTANTSSTTFVSNEIATGSGTAFAISGTPVSGSTQVYANGQRLTPSVDYTISGKNITTVDSWSAGALLVDYQE